MTTRSGLKWLVIYGPHGPYVARRDSPAAIEAREQGVATSKFIRTLGAACRKMRRLRGVTENFDPADQRVR